jgi:hypothetical protein
VAADTCARASTSRVTEYRPGPHVGSVSLTTNDTARRFGALASVLALPEPGSTANDCSDVPSNTTGPSAEEEGVCVCEPVGVWLGVRVCEKLGVGA